MMWRYALVFMLTTPALAESVVATRTLRPNSVIGPDDLTIVDAKLPGALTDPAQALGLETRVAIYAGRPVLRSDLGELTLVQRNQIVSLIYLAGGLAISTEGRALSRGSEGETVRVINLGSRTTVSGQVGPDGAVYVGLDE
jgi:flagella basal body P-ring formation protein FlgA